MTRIPQRLLAPLALLGAACSPIAAQTVPVTLAETRVQACSYAGFQIGNPDSCVSRPGEFPGTGIGIDNHAIAGPIPDPAPGSSKVAQAISNTYAQFGLLRIDDLAGGIVSGVFNPLLRANATSRASFSDVLTFRAPASMSTADFRASVANLSFAFNASTSLWSSSGSAELWAYVNQRGSFNSNFYPGSGRLLAFADSSGARSEPADRVLHLALDNGTNDRFVKFALTLELIGDARMVEGSVQATAWLADISFSQRVATSGAAAALGVAGDAAAPEGISVSSASREMVLDPVTGRFGYISAAAVPEPASAGLLGLGLGLLAWWRRQGAAVGSGRRQPGG